MSAYADGMIEGGYSCHFGKLFNFIYGGWIMGAIFLVVVGIIIFFAVKGLTGKTGEEVQDLKREALAAVKVRLAKGEISQEEYDNIKKKLLEE